MSPPPRPREPDAPDSPSSILSKPHSSHSTRSSVSHSGPPRMPSIAEDEALYRAYRSSMLQPGSGSSRAPLRVPQKSPRRALIRAQQDQQRHLERERLGREGKEPPPYGISQLPPRYRESVAAGSEASGSGSEGPGEKGAVGGDEPPKGWMDRQWFGRRRTRWCFFIGVGLVIVAIVVGLAVGLTLGLKKGNSNNDSKESNDGNNNKDAPFPAGSYSFETTLQSQSTDCTSRASTWRCYPYNLNSPATFYWILNPSDNGGFTISSSENPFAPSFDNITLSTVDKDGDDERYTFEFDTDRTVVPADALTDDNRAAKCTFAKTKFQATLWTKRGAGEDAKKGSGKFANWPADVEIVQSKASELGQPVCEDDDGNAIADVQAASGDCSCEYANFEL